MSAAEGPHSARKVGVIGGTFDPIHIGHLFIAERVQEALELDNMLFVPAWVSPLKLASAPTSAEHRLAMLRLAVADNKDFGISLVELERKGPSFTVDTLVALRERLGQEDTLTFVLGTDALIELPRWHQPDRLIRLARLATVPRRGFAPDLDVLEAAVPGVRDSIHIVDAPTLEISATDLRACVAAGRSIRYLVPDPVRRYILDHGLYCAGSSE